MKIKFTIAVLLFFLMSGCSSISISDIEGTEISTGEKVLLKTNNTGLIVRAILFFDDPVDVSVDKIDSTRISRGLGLKNPFVVDEEFAIKPGLHTLKVSCTNNAVGKYSIRDRGTLFFEANLGNWYEISAGEAYSSGNSECNFKIVEIPLRKK